MTEYREAFRIDDAAFDGDVHEFMDQLVDNASNAYTVFWDVGRMDYVVMERC